MPDYDNDIGSTEDEELIKRILTQILACTLPALTIACKGDPDKSRANALERLNRQRSALTQCFLHIVGQSDLADKFAGAVMHLAEERIEAIYAERKENAEMRRAAYDGPTNAHGLPLSAAMLIKASDDLKARLGECRQRIRSAYGRMFGLLLLLLGALGFDYVLIAWANFARAEDSDAGALVQAGGTALGALTVLVLLAHYGPCPLLVGQEDRPRVTLTTVLCTVASFVVAGYVAQMRSDGLSTDDFSAARILMILGMPAISLIVYLLGQMICALYKEVKEGADPREMGRQLREMTSSLRRLRVAEKRMQPLVQAENDLRARVTHHTPSKRDKTEDTAYQNALRALAADIAAAAGQEEPGPLSVVFDERLPNRRAGSHARNGNTHRESADPSEMQAGRNDSSSRKDLQ